MCPCPIPTHFVGKAQSKLPQPSGEAPRLPRWELGFSVSHFGEAKLRSSWTKSNRGVRDWLPRHL
jgi:hypothetical protein